MILYPYFSNFQKMRILKIIHSVADSKPFVIKYTQFEKKYRKYAISGKRVLKFQVHTNEMRQLLAEVNARIQDCRVLASSSESGTTISYGSNLWWRHCLKVLSSPLTVKGGFTYLWKHIQSVILAVVPKVSCSKGCMRSKLKTTGDSISMRNWHSWRQILNPSLTAGHVRSTDYCPFMSRW